jgi:hypothetical protein
VRAPVRCDSFELDDGRKRYFLELNAPAAEALALVLHYIEGHPEGPGGLLRAIAKAMEGEGVSAANVMSRWEDHPEVKGKITIEARIGSL